MWSLQRERQEERETVSISHPYSQGSFMQIICLWATEKCYLFSLLEVASRFPVCDINLLLHIVVYESLNGSHISWGANEIFRRGQSTITTSTGVYCVAFWLSTHTLTIMPICARWTPKCLYYVEVVRRFSFFFLSFLFFYFRFFLSFSFTSLVLRNVSMYTSQSTSLWMEPN